jgi:hypothetical protein
VGQYSSGWGVVRGLVVVRPRENLNELMHAAARTTTLSGSEPIADRASFETVG